MKHVFIVNPTSGVGKYQVVIDYVKDYFEDKEDNYEIRITEYVGHATEIAREYDVSHVLYSVGGDGTSHEIINGMQEGVSLGIIPVGTGNDFFRNFDLDLPLEKIIEKPSGQKLKISFKEKSEFEKLEKEIAGLEVEKKLLEVKLSNAAMQYDALQETSEKINTIILQLDEKENRWLELSEKFDHSGV